MFRVAPPSFSLSRRSFIAGGAALLASTAATPVFAGGVSAFVDSIWSAAKARGVSRRAFDAGMAGFRPLESVIKLTGKQPEKASTAAGYLSTRVTGDKAATGRALHGEWAQTLGAIEQRYGVQPEAVLAIWGIETNFGSYKGKTNTVHALATLTYAGYREKYFGEELLTSLQVLSDGHVAADHMVGSWAGAMGHPQFMPSSFMRYAVDFRGDGHKDIWDSVPDALASAGNYLNGHGWRPGETWGYEVQLPRGFNYAHVWSSTTMSLGDWAGQGVARANGKAFPRASDSARLMMPMGGHGPVFLVLPNFGVIKRYNASDLYALAVGHLADRILGSKGFVASWPEDSGLTSAGKAEVQNLLLGKGYAIGSADGKIGPKTRAAVIDWQARAGLLPDGHVGGNLLAALRG